MSKNITIEFTTDHEAGLVYGTLRRLKREGYTQSYHIGDDYSVANIADDSDVDAVLAVFHGLKKAGNQGINAFEGGTV